MVNWWYIIPAVGLGLYLLAGMGPWPILQWMGWLLRRDGPFLEGETERLQALMDAAGSQESLWPEVPRPGRYQQPDQEARERLSEITVVIEEIRDIWPALQSFRFSQPTVVDLLLLRGWGPLLKSVVTWRDVRAVRRLLDRGEENLAALGEQQVLVEEIPHIVRALLNEARAEGRRLGAMLEAEEEAGTVDLEDVRRRLEHTGASLDAALDLLDGTAAEDMPTTVTHVDAALEAATASIAELDQLLQRLATARTRAQNLIARVNSSLDFIAERWEGLKSRGATEPAIAEALAGIRNDTSRLSEVISARTLQAYDAVAQEVADFDARIESLTDRLGALDTLMNRSKEAMEGSVRALADAQSACDHLTRQIEQIEPDLSLSLIEKASDIYRQAERRRDLGTTEGYQAAIALAERARDYLEQAVTGVEPLADTVNDIEELLDELDEETLADRYRRLEEARTALQMYARHWDDRLDAADGEAEAGLRAIEDQLEQLPEDVRYRRHYRQSEMPECLDTLTRAREELERVTDLVVSMEDERTRLDGLRTELDETITRIKDEMLPPLTAARERMLPELQQRYDSLYDALAEQFEALADMGQVDYDRAVNEWLPATLRQIEEVQQACESDLQHYARMRRETVTRIDKAWARLTRLDPVAQPGPDESVESLANDLDIWRNEVERHAENPAALRDLLGRRAGTLEQRIEGIYHQIVEGRRNLDALDKQYRRVLQSGRNLRNRVREMQRDNPWKGIGWDTDPVDAIWERTIALERESQEAPTLMQAGNLLQQALNAAQEAEAGYSRLHAQIDSSLRRLEEEARAIESSLERGRRRADQLRAQGQTEELAALEEYYAGALRIRTLAQNATTVEEALRQLRQARDLLNSM